MKRSMKKPFRHARTAAAMKRTAAASLALLLASGAVPFSACAAVSGQPQAAETASAVNEEAEARKEVISIRNEDEFLAFCHACRNQGYSVGREIRLEADLDLSDLSAEPVPVFSGIFDGCGRTIRGFSLTEKSSASGLFRYVEAGAVVKNLNLEGELVPEGSRAKIGGIAGVNRGRITNCSFSGYGEALECLGGIAGCNEASGVIENCRNRAVLNGNSEIGGIAGRNEGTIFACLNSGEINTAAEGVENSGDAMDHISFSMDIAVDREHLMKDLVTEKVYDVGGIAGSSSGFVSECRNSGPVGYASTGYNIGGIAGRQSGTVNACKNSGAVVGRKDVGGVVGQLEPVLAIDYGSSTIDKVSDIMDQMMDTKDAMSDTIRETGNTTTDSTDRMDEILKQIRDLTRDRKADQRVIRKDYEAKANRKLDDIDTTLANMELELGSRKADRASTRIKNNIAALRQLFAAIGGDETDIEIPLIDDRMPTEEELAGLSEAAKQEILNQVQDAKSLAEEVERIAKNLYNDTDDYITSTINGVQDGIQDFADQLDDLRIASKELLDMTRDYKDQLIETVELTDDDVTEKLNSLYKELDDLSDNLKNNRNRFRSEQDALDDQMRGLKESIDDGRDRLRRQQEDLTDSDKPLFEDISDRLESESGKEAKGIVADSGNSGEVTADYQAGGIVGTIGMELSLNPDDNIEAHGDRTLDMTRTAGASVRGCRNDGTVFVKKDYAGGIVGAAWVGALSENSNYGNVKTDDGDYAGGIAGSSLGTIRGSYVMCEVAGNNYAGGIAGNGKHLSDNFAMANIHAPEGEWLGSIAGSCEDDAVISGNRYVNDQFGAVDGITYVGQAQEIAAEAVTTEESLPREFKTMHVTFLADDVVVKEIICPYGSAVKLSAYPEVPKKEGFYEAWEEQDLSDVRRNYRISAVYRPWVKTVASSADPKPELLAEAEFYPGASLEIGETDPAGLSAPEGYHLAKAFHYAAADPENPQPNTRVILHAHAGSKGEVGIVTEKGIDLISVKQDNEYVVFEADAEGTYVLLTKIPYKGYAGGAAAAVLAALAGLFVWKRRKKNHDGTGEQNKNPEETGTGENSSEPGADTD